MKWISLQVMICLSCSFVRAQNQLNIAAGTDLFISSGTEFSYDGISFIPSADFTINGLSLQRNTTVSHPTFNNYISRVYQFSGNTPSFSGSIRFHYEEAELNGLNELSLELNIYHGAGWQSFNSTANDDINNFVLTNGISNLILNELTLADALMPLPLKWGLVAAYRQDRTVKIVWNTYEEKNIDHFEVERSADSRNWNTVINRVGAVNTNGDHKYLQTDPDYQPQRFYYRIKQVSIDGSFEYSVIVMVNEAKNINRLLVYPNPFTTSFNIGNYDPSRIKAVMLYNSDGILLRLWNTPQSIYKMENLITGIYLVKIIMTDGSSQQAVLQKQ